MMGMMTTMIILNTGTNNKSMLGGICNPSNPAFSRGDRHELEHGIQCIIQSCEWNWVLHVLTLVSP